MPDYSSDLFFSSNYNPHTDRSTFLTILTILESYNSYLTNLKYWRKSLRSSIFTSSKKIKETKGSPFQFFSALWDFFSAKKFPQMVPPSIFWSFPTERMLKNPKGSPFQFFGIVRFFFKKFFFTKSAPPSIFWWYATEWMKNLKVSPLVRQISSTFGFFRYRRREYFDTLKSFWCFWALDMAPTWAVPGLLYFFKDQNKPELTKIVLPKVLQNLQKTPKCTWWPKELNQKGFPRNIQYRTRPKGPFFQFFFSIVGLFSKFFFRKSVPNSPILGNLKSFCYFWALDMAPTWAVPGLFKTDSKRRTLKLTFNY